MPIPSGFLASLDVLFPLTVSIKEVTIDPTGADESALNYGTTVYSGVKARRMKINAQADPGTYEYTGGNASHTVLLRGLYSGIEPGMVMVNGSAVDKILYARADGGGNQTKLYVQELP